MMRELSAVERIQPPSMTRIVNILEERGMVLRKPSDHDRRQHVVALTDAGTEVLLANRRRRDEWLVRRIDDSDANERKVLRRALLIFDRLDNA